MKNKIVRGLLILIITILLELLLTTKVNAALSISTSKSTVEPGENFAVTVSVSSNEAGAIYLSANNGTLSSTYIDLMSQASVTITCTAGNSGTISIYASGQVANYDTETEGEQSASKSITIATPTEPITPPSDNTSGNSNNNTSTGSGTSGSSSSSTNTTKPKEEEKSNDSTLKELVIEGYELYPVFDANTKEYNIRVTNDITSINVIPTVNNSKASYTIEGTTNELLVGKNVITVVVTAEDGTTSNYVINVTREREGLNVQYIKIYYIDETGVKKELLLNPEFSTEIIEYTLTDLSYLVSKLEVEVATNLEQAQIEVEGNEKLVDGTNTITVTVTVPSESEEEADEVLTYKIMVNKEKEPVVTLIGKIKNWYNNNTQQILTGALMLCSVALGGLTVYLITDYKKYRMLIKKVAEITKMNNADVVNVEETDNTNQELLEEMQNNASETEIKTRGKHF